MRNGFPYFSGFRDPLACLSQAYLNKCINDSRHQFWWETQRPPPSENFEALAFMGKWHHFHVIIAGREGELR